VVLKQIKRDPPVFIQGDDLAVHEGAGGKLFAGAGDMRELLCEEVSSPGPARYALGIPPAKAAVSVELNLLEPFLSFWQLVDQSRIHRLDELQLGSDQIRRVFRLHSARCSKSRTYCAADDNLSRTIRVLPEATQSYR
jgi:hypothetical protein